MLVCEIKTVAALVSGMMLVIERLGRNTIRRTRLRWLFGYGDNPVSFGAILGALKENEIPTHDMAAHSHLISYEAGLLRPQYAIFVHAAQAEDARKIISELGDSSSREA
jgi:hypothetical protein